MTDITAWLEQLGLNHDEAIFRENAIAADEVIE